MHPWEPTNDEEDTISTIFLEDRGFDAIPADGSDDRAKYDNTVVQYIHASRISYEHASSQA
jgi:hypothetical protein